MLGLQEQWPRRHGGPKKISVRYDVVQEAKTGPGESCSPKSRHVLYRAPPAIGDSRMAGDEDDDDDDVDDDWYLFRCDDGQ